MSPKDINTTLHCQLKNGFASSEVLLKIWIGHHLPPNGFTLSEEALRKTNVKSVSINSTHTQLSVRLHSDRCQQYMVSVFCLLGLFTSTPKLVYFLVLSVLCMFKIGYRRYYSQYWEFLHHFTMERGKIRWESYWQILKLLWHGTFGACTILWFVSIDTDNKPTPWSQWKSRRKLGSVSDTTKILKKSW
jgi:hypothetical protein